MNENLSARYFWPLLACLFILVTVLASGGFPSCGGGFDGDDDGKGELGSTQHDPSTETGDPNEDTSSDKSSYGLKFLGAENLITREGGKTTGFNIVLKSKLFLKI